LRKQGLSERLAYHVSSLFVRDPIPAYEGELDFKVFMQCEKQDCNSEELSTEEEKNAAADWWTKAPQTDDVCHFENIQSTNWNTMRFKSPPAHDTDIGWRVEFRPLDIQLTDFENAAYTVLVGMTANIINQFSLDFVIPISLVDQGMTDCHFQDALQTQ